MNSQTHRLRCFSGSFHWLRGHTRATLQRCESLAPSSGEFSLFTSQVRHRQQYQVTGRRRTDGFSLRRLSLHGSRTTSNYRPEGDEQPPSWRPHDLPVLHLVQNVRRYLTRTAADRSVVVAVVMMVGGAVKSRRTTRSSPNTTYLPPPPPTATSHHLHWFTSRLVPLVVVGGSRWRVEVEGRGN